jgi:hypothetical protein
VRYEIEITEEAESDLDDDVTDDLIAKHPAFLETIRRARQQKAAGRVRRLEDVRQKYEAESNG